MVPSGTPEITDKLLHFAPVIALRSFSRAATHYTNTASRLQARSGDSNGEPAF